MICHGLFYLVKSVSEERNSLDHIIMLIVFPSYNSLIHSPEVRRTAYRVANNILRSGAGKVFVKFCFDSELSLDDILPFALFGVSVSSFNFENC